MLQLQSKKYKHLLRKPYLLGFLFSMKNRKKQRIKTTKNRPKISTVIFIFYYF